MSRVAKNPIPLPAGVEASINGNRLIIKGSKGSLERDIPSAVKVIKENNTLTFSPDLTAEGADALAGTIRATANNMVIGVTKGFEKKLTLVGVGYRAQAQNDTLNLTLGHSHPVVYKSPKGIIIKTPTQTEIVIEGADKQQVGQVAADIRSFRSPEPYKGKGARYSDEVIILKEAKKK